jgi:hypothetical protein
VIVQQYKPISEQNQPALLVNSVDVSHLLERVVFSTSYNALCNQYRDMHFFKLSGVVDEPVLASQRYARL